MRAVGKDHVELRRGALGEGAEGLEEDALAIGRPMRIPLCWLLGQSVQKSAVFGSMILLYYCTSLWHMMLFDCLNSVRSMLLSQGQLNSVTQKVFRKQYKTKEEFII
jgi:hypothetical protein